MNDPRPPVREGYNRDPLPGQPAERMEFEPEYIEGQTIYNIPLIVGLAIAAVAGSAGFLIPAAIIMWRWAL